MRHVVSFVRKEKRTPQNWEVRLSRVAASIIQARFLHARLATSFIIRRLLSHDNKTLTTCRSLHNYLYTHHTDMSDRLTQLQLCLDQLIDILFSSLSYIDQNHDSVPLDPSDPKEEDPNHNPPIPYEFQSSQQELATDIILKTRQILTIIDTLPGVGVTKKEQIETIQNLRIQLQDAENEKMRAVQEKEKLLDFVNTLILDVGETIAATRWESCAQTVQYDIVDRSVHNLIDQFTKVHVLSLCGCRHALFLLMQQRSISPYFDFWFLPTS